MRGITSIERSVLKDAAQPPLTADELEFLHRDAGDTGMSPAEEAAVQTLLLRKCICVEQTIVIRGEEHVFYGLTELGRIALTLVSD